MIIRTMHKSITLLLASTRLKGCINARAHGSGSVGVCSQTGSDRSCVHTRPPLPGLGLLFVLAWIGYQFGSDPLRSRGDARIRSRTGADAKRGLFSLLSTRVSCAHLEASFTSALLWSDPYRWHLHGTCMDRIQTRTDPNWICSRLQAA